MKTRLKLFKKYFKKNVGSVNQDVLTHIKNDYEQAVTKAKAFLQIENETVGGPITISVPDAYFGNKKVNFKNVLFEDKTNQVIYDQSLLTAIFFGEQHLYYYQSNIDHRVGLIDYDVAGQIPYDKIVHIQQLLSYDNPNNPTLQQLDIELNLVDGSVIPLRLRNKFLKFEDDSKELVLTEKESALLKALKQAI